MRRTSAISWRAIALRSMSTAPAGRIVASSREARSAESCRGAPPGRRSRSRRCSRLTARRRSEVSSSRRSESSRNTAQWSSGATRERSSRCWATTATLRASMPSLLRPWPRWSTRVRAASAEGTSTTVSPEATSCWASSRPRPLAPSIAQTRCGQHAAHAASRASVALSASTRSSPSMAPVSSSATAVCELLWGSMPMVITGAPQRPTTRTDTAAGNLSSSNSDHASIEPRQRRAATARHAMRQPRRGGQEA